MTDLALPNRHLGRAAMLVALQIAFLVMPVTAVYVPLGLAPLFGAVVVFGVLSQFRLWAWPRNAIGVLIPVICAWMAITALWALEPGGSLKKALGVGGLMAFGTVLALQIHRLDPALRRRMGWAAVAGLILGLSAILVECLADGLLLRVMAPEYYSHPVMTKRGAVIAVLVMWPALAFLVSQGRRAAAIALLLFTVGVVAYSPSGAGKLGLLAGAIAALGGWLLRERMFKILAGMVVFTVLTVPVMAQFIPTPQSMWDDYPHMVFSHHHRLKIWRFTGQRIAEHPIRGWGMDSSRAMPGGNDEDVFHRIRPGTDMNEAFREANMPLHPHNAILQWELELGLPGLLLMGGLLAAICLTAGRRAVTRANGMLLSASALGTLATAAVAFGAWQSWWLSAVMLAVALWSAILPSEADKAGAA